VRSDVDFDLKCHHSTDGSLRRAVFDFGVQTQTQHMLPCQCIGSRGDRSIAGDEALEGLAPFNLSAPRAEHVHDTQPAMRTSRVSSLAQCEQILRDPLLQQGSAIRFA